MTEDGPDSGLVVGLPIDDHDMPEWAKDQFSPKQLGCDRGLRWMLLVYKVVGWEPSRVNVAQRLYVHTVGHEQKSARPSLATLALDLKMSKTTVVESLEDLIGRELLVKVGGGGRANYNVYRLAWPPEDCLSAVDGPDLCSRPTERGVCTRTSGRGTATPGVGPCHLHGGVPKNPKTVQPLDSFSDGLELESVQWLGANGSVAGHETVQPLETNGSAAGLEYVGSSLRGVRYLSNPPLVPAQPPVQAREAEQQDEEEPAEVGDSGTLRARDENPPTRQAVPEDTEAQRHAQLALLEASINGSDPETLIQAEHDTASADGAPIYRPTAILRAAARLTQGAPA